MNTDKTYSIRNKTDQMIYEKSSLIEVHGYNIEWGGTWCLPDAGPDDTEPSLDFSFLLASTDDLPWSSTLLLLWFPASVALTFSFMFFSFFMLDFGAAVCCALQTSTHSQSASFTKLFGSK